MSVLKQCINGLRSIDAIQPAACLNVVMMWLFIYCYFGDQMTSRFENIQSTLYLCEWYLLPIELEKSIPMILQSSKKCIYLQGFGSSSCTRETFKKVFFKLSIKKINNFINYLIIFQIVNVGFSYFTMLRQVQPSV